ncbi:MAG TPA: T9SS type A sorting domain-containing protein [Candidatus Kapabacteria bacterium]|nr:T9SS type A sorting domain-containing protein [Candidatus Kapabacteria bacterium]
MMSTAPAQQWSRLMLSDNSWSGPAPYFLNKNLGFIFNTGYRGWSDQSDSTLQRTTDGGSTWTLIQRSETFGAISQMIFISDFHGYFAGAHGIYETLDTGLTWKRISQDTLAYNSVYAIENKVFAYVATRPVPKGTPVPGQLDSSVLFRYFGPLLKTADDGKQWDTIIPRRLVSRGSIPALWSSFDPQCVMGNKENLVFSIDYTMRGDTYLISSVDTGTIWTSVAIDSSSPAVMGMFSFPHCSRLLEVRDNNNDQYAFFYSDDTGRTWVSSQLIYETSAWISGNNCACYVSDASDHQGIYRSLTHGKDWKFIAGPSFGEQDDNDFRNISVVGGGAIVYAGSKYIGGSALNSGVRKSIDGGDGKLSENQLASRISLSTVLSSGGLDTLYTTYCDTSSFLLIFQNLNCNFAHFDSLDISGIDSSEYSTILKHHSLCDGVPDTLIVSVYSLPRGIRNIGVALHFSNDEFLKIDTAVNTTISIQSASPATVYIKPQAVSATAGEIVDIPVYMTAGFGVSVFKLGGIITGTLNFSMNTEFLTPLRFVPTLSGLVVSNFTVAGNQATILLVDSSGINISRDTVIGILRCIIYLTDTLQTAVTFTGDNFTSDQNSPCATLSVESDSVIISLSYQCGDSILFRFLKYDSLFRILSIIPNPAKNNIEVVMINRGSVIYYELFDALGVTRKHGSTGQRSLTLDVSDLPSGKYYLRVSGPGGVPATEPIVILR